MNVVTLILFIAGLFILIGGAELLVRGASKLAVGLGISPLVVGLTVVAYGTSAPELAVSVQSSFLGQADIALGNVLGSNIANILLILGLSAIITPLVISLQLIRFDVPLMIAASIMLFVMSLDSVIGRLDGGILFTCGITYTAWLIYQSRKETHQDTESMLTIDTEQVSPHKLAWVKHIAFVIVGLGLLVIGARWLVDGATAFARMFGMSELIIGITIVAIGTSLPEIATSVIASMHGQRDMAVGNVVGSNIFNILSVIGITSMVAPLGIHVPSVALHIDIPIMIAVAIACLPIFFTGKVITRWEGALFMGYYVAYTCYLVLRDTGHTALPLFSQAMLFVALPVTCVLLVATTIRDIRGSSQG